MPASVETAPALAIVIPAFKGRHLARTLESLANQTDQRFRVHVADDASPENLAAIVEPFRTRLDLHYERFEENWGRRSLISHWDRAIARTSEPWLLLFGDDDKLSPSAVAGFNQLLHEGLDPFALAVWNITRIDTEDRPIAEVPEPPAREGWRAYTHRMFHDPHFFCVMQNVCFSRENYRACGGFNDYPSGYWADHLTWTRFAVRGGLVRIPVGRVLYRQHDGSLGGGVMFGRGDRSAMIESMGRMLDGLRALMDQEGPSQGCGDWWQLLWFARKLRYIARPLDAGELRTARAVMRRLWPWWPGLRHAVFAWHALRAHARKLALTQWYLALWGRSSPSPQRGD